MQSARDAGARAGMAAMHDLTISNLSPRAGVARHHVTTGSAPGSKVGRQSLTGGCSLREARLHVAEATAA